MLHWIKKLREEQQAAIEGLVEIRKYLNSDKFSVDIMVNKNDILLRIAEIFTTLEDIRSK